MQTYYQQLSELRIEEARLITLKKQKEILLNKATKTTGTISDNTSHASGISNKPLSYVKQCEKIDKKIVLQEQKIEILKNGLSEMVSILRELETKAQKENDSLELKIFRFRYIDGKRKTQIAREVPCGLATVYRYLEKYEKRKVEKK